MNRATKLLIESLNKELEKLEKDFQDVDQKRMSEGNPQEKNNLQLLLNDIAKQIQQKDLKVKKLTQQSEEDNIQELLQILTELVNSQSENSIDIKIAYRACSPEGWLYLTTNSIAAILADLEKMPKGNSQHTRVEHFMAYLIASINLISPVYRQLKQWAEENIKDFSELLNREKNSLEKRRKQTNSYLLMVFEKSNQESVRKNSEFYNVKASFIPDIQLYDYRSGSGCKPVDVPEIDSKTFTIDEIPEVLNHCLNAICVYSFSNLTIEVFLPLDLLNHNIDCCELKDELDLGFPTLIGQDYKIAVRSYERLTDAYKRLKGFWEQKWERLQDCLHEPDCNSFLQGDEETVNALFPKLKLPDTIGLKVVKAPKKIGRNSIFAAILKTAIPVALWLRYNPSGLDCESEIEQIFDCCIHHLPEAVKNKRGSANRDNVDTDIGHHISLLWEDPYRLPPSINYSM